MRRSWWSRSFSAVFAVWFALLVAEPVTIMHQCPVHDGALAMQHMMHAPGGMTMAHTADGAPERPTHGSHHQCTCIGDCAGATAVGIPGSRASLVIATDAAVARDTGLPAYRYVAAWTQYLLPFENGPPRA